MLSSALEIRAVLKDAACLRQNRVPAVDQGVRVTATSQRALVAARRQAVSGIALHRG
jgi:hypothetical protein